MPRGPQPPQVTSGQAQYVIERLVAERRIAPGEIARYLSELSREIDDLETRLTRLREASGSGTQRASRATRAAAASQPVRRRARRANRLQGSYMGYMRQVRDERKKAEFRRIKDEKGFERAIAAIRQHLGK